MRVNVAAEPLAEAAAEALVVWLFTDRALDGVVAALDTQLRGTIAGAIADGELHGRANECTLFHASRAAVRRILVVGLGDRGSFELSGLAQYAGTAVRYLGQRGVREVVITIPSFARDQATRAASFVVEGAIVATFETGMYHTKREHSIELKVLTLVAGWAEPKQLEIGAARGRIIGESVNCARTLALTPANQMTPRTLAERAAAVAVEAELAFEALDEAAMRELGMGALLSVSQGSAEPARLIILSYDGDRDSSERLGLVGKGITFDSGGISLKKPVDMPEMKYDMSGGAGVIGTLRAVGFLKPKLNVVGVVAASENLPGPSATKPGDVHRAMNGTTIEIVNTDAEGRLVLADGLVYARERQGATRLIDAATLTGTIITSLGYAAAGAMTNDDIFLERFLSSANESGERYWQLPIYDEYLELTKSEIADLKNFTGLHAASLVAAAFLREFVGNTPWIHLDLSGTAYGFSGGTPYRASGPTGFPVRALTAFIESEALSRGGGC